MLFFADMDAWEAYANEHGIVYGDGVLTDAPDPEPTETEMPTIEVPTQGAGLEYVPPEQFEQQGGSGCKSVIGISAVLCLIGCVIVTYRKRD